MLCYSECTCSGVCGVTVSVPVVGVLCCSECTCSGVCCVTVSAPVVSVPVVECVVLQ